MNRNDFSRFALAPQVNAPRSTFDRSSNLKTSFNVGDLVPIFVDEVLPGDEYSVKTSKVLRLQTLLTPVMDSLFFDVYFFFVPNRLVWSHWQELMGENSDSAWIPEVEYSVPQITAPEGGWSEGTIADYFGIPPYVDDLSVNALPFRAYALICDEWFRDQNNSQPLNIPVTDSTVVGVNTGNYVTDTAKGGLPFKAAKYHDYFTSCLPAPQKGDSVSLPLSGPVPVYTRNKLIYDLSADKQYYPSDFSFFARYASSNGSAPLGLTDMGPRDVRFNVSTISQYLEEGSNGTTFTPSTDSVKYPVPINLFADLRQATAVSINELRSAFQIQRMLEKDARGGTRYVEIIKSHFGVTSPDARLQRPEYLGGSRFPFNVEQVSQTSSTDAVTPQGNLSGFSQTVDVNFDFHKAFVEHGFIIGLACARYEHSYQQGLERFWSRSTRYDYYWPALAHLGEQAVKNREIYATGDSTDNEVFGYQEAWADYRYKPNRISGEMRSTSSLPLDSWHFGDDYSDLPVLSDGWIREDLNNIDRTLAVTSADANQIFGDIYFQCKVTRCMPLYSVPGLIDHF